VLDLAGCEKLFGSPEKIVHDLKRIASEVGLEANVAVTGNPLAAVCAAQGFFGVTVIPAGDERLQMGRLSLEGLRIPFEFVETLRRWGVRTCKEFAALPEIAIVERLGQEGSKILSSTSYVIFVVTDSDYYGQRVKSLFLC
jgi:protein ImuB